MRLSDLWLTACVLLFLALPTTASAQQSVGEKVYAAVSPAVLLIETYDAGGNRNGTATAFIVSANELLTNAHVADAGLMKARVGPVALDCETARIDRDNDLALCRIKATFSDPPIPFAPSLPAPGAPVFAIGNPKGLERTISEGLFAGLRDVDSRKVAQISAAISPGSSGGPVVNASGQLIGVAVSSLVNGQSLNFAVPLEAVRAFLAGAQDSDTADGLIARARRLSSERDEKDVLSDAWAQLNSQVVAALRLAIGKAVNVETLRDVIDIAPLFEGVKQEAARKAIQIAKTPDRIFYAELASALYLGGFGTDPTPAELTEAEAAATKAVTLSSPARVEDLILLGDIQVAANKFTPASATYQRALAGPKITPDETAKAYLGLYQASKTNKPAEAAQWFARAEGARHQPARQWFDLGRFLDSQSRYAEAGDAYAQASSAAPKYAQYACEAGSSYGVTDRADDTLRWSRRCIELATSSKGNEALLATAHQDIALVLIDRGVYEEAASQAREAIALQPESANAHHSLARALAKLRRFSEAVTAAKTAIRLSDGKWAFMHFTLGEAYFDLERWPEAAQSFETAANLNSTDGASAYNVAASQYNAGNRSEAARWFREVLRREPNRSDRAEILKKLQALP